MEHDKSSKVNSRQKQAACLECRKSKTKCIRNPEGSACRKCQSTGTACVVPAYHIGRYKGIKNKRSGLEKAIHQVETAVRRSRRGDSGLDAQQTQALEQLLRQTSDTGESQQSTAYSPVDSNDVLPSSVRSYSHHNRQLSSTSHDESLVDSVEDTGDLTVNNADNPLQLLAVASTIPESSPLNDTLRSGHGAAGDSNGISRDSNPTQRFFTPIKSKLDLSEDLDPIKLGLATELEALSLFDYFHQHLAHTRWGMDSKIHTWMFVRSRSAFLFTSIMAASALFLPDTAALCQRLRNHVQKMVGIIAAQKYRSMEIVLGLMINVPWMVVGQEWAADDNTCYYLSTALTIALDLSMNKIVIPSAAFHTPGFLDRINRADCIDAAKALTTDCLDHIAPSSDIGRRLLRARERIWLALFNLDRGVCLARGRPPTVPVTALVESCETWHICDLSDGQDGALVSTTILRRDFLGLISSIRNTCDSQPLISIGEDSTTIRVMRDHIEKFFDQWLATWRFEIQQNDGSLAPYVEILASHTKLSAYCSVINHPTAPVDVRKFFRTAGLASALNVLRVAVRSETRLRSMPNNTVILVSFAAFFALGLSNDRSLQSASTTTSNINSLIAEVADVLQRLGSVPEHRQGASVWFGKHIKAIIQRSSFSHLHSHSHSHSHSRLHLQPQSQSKSQPQFFNNDSAPTTVNSILQQNNGNTNFTMPVVDGVQQPLTSNPNQSGTFIPTFEEFPVFDMTNDQIIDSIVNSKDDIDVLGGDMLYDESQFLDWFDSLG